MPTCRLNTLYLTTGLSSSIAINIDPNFEESNRKESDSVLPKVRSDVVKYLTEGDSGLEKLIVEGRDTIGRSLHYRVYGGYLDRSQVPEVRCCIGVRSRLAFGASATFASRGNTIAVSDF